MAEDACAGGSGRAFKFSPTIGDMMASLVTGDESPVNLERFLARQEAIVVGREAVKEATTEALEPVVA